MLSLITLTRNYSARLALDAFRNDTPSTTGTDSTSPAARLLNSLGVDVGGVPGLDSKTMMKLLEMLQNQENGQTVGETSDPLQVPFASVDSQEFMKALKDKLAKTDDDPVSYVNSQAMLNALKDGTLKITDPVNGETVTGWDPATGAKPNDAEKVDRDGWNEFLKDHLKRGDDGSFVKSESGTYVDAATGDNAVFSRINGKYYYFTWPVDGVDAGK